MVVALKIRTASADSARDQVGRSARWLREQGVVGVFSEYCSTFDSTAAGNIGPITDELIDTLGASATVHCPSCPANARTVYQGHLFVGCSLLHESGMQHHPLTPMTDANLVRVLQAQTTRSVALLTAHRPGSRRPGLDRLVGDGAAPVIADAVTDRDIDELAAATGAFRCSPVGRRSGQRSGPPSATARRLLGHDVGPMPG